MTAVNHDSWDIEISVVVLLAKLAFILVKEFAYELIDLFSVEVRWVLGLLEEESGGVFKFFHLIQN